MPIAKLTTTTILRLAGAAGIVIYLFGGALQGILQQAPDLAPQEIDCGYRLQLLRARLATAIDSPGAQLRSFTLGPDTTRLSPISQLLRQTLRHCPATHPELTEEFNALQRSHDELVEMHQRTAQLHDRLGADAEGSMK